MAQPAPPPPPGWAFEAAADPLAADGQPRRRVGVGGDPVATPRGLGGVRSAYTGDVFTILDAVSRWAIPVMIALVPAWALLKRVDVYTEFLDGARVAVELGVRILP